MFGPEYFRVVGYLGDGYVLCPGCGEDDGAFGRETDPLRPLNACDTENASGKCRCNGGGITCDQCDSAIAEPADCECEEGHTIPECDESCVECLEDRTEEQAEVLERVGAVLGLLLQRASMDHAVRLELQALAGAVADVLPPVEVSNRAAF